MWKRKGRFVIKEKGEKSKHRQSIHAPFLQVSNTKEKKGKTRKEGGGQLGIWELGIVANTTPASLVVRPEYHWSRPALA